MQKLLYLCALLLVFITVMELQKGHIAGADLARIVGALGIVLFHFSCYCEPLKPFLYSTSNMPYGPIWVALFFALSGACIVRSNTDTPIGLFYRKRWMSVFPIFFIAYLLAFALKLVVWGYWWGSISPWTFPLTLIGMDSYFYYLRPNFCCVGEWFIGALLICYLLYPLLRKALHHLPYTTTVILVAGSCFIPFISWFTIEPWHNVWVCVTIFYLGMLLAQFPAVFTSKISFALSAILTLILFVVPLPFKQVGALSQIIYPILTGLVCLVLLVHTGVYLERQERLKQGMTYLGKLSYPIFLVQQTTIQAVFSKWSALSLSEACTLLGMDILLTFLFAYIIITIHTELTHRHEKSIRHNA